MPFRETFACGFQKCVGDLWKGDDYSDFNVIVEDTSFKCHRFILSACSVFFQCMFKSPLKEQKEGRAKLEGMTASTFEIIINAVYTGVEELSIDNVLDVWSASELLQISYLTKQCHTFVMENISVETCFRFLKHATLYAAQTVIDHYLNFISSNFEKFRNEIRLLHLPFDQFYKVIANDYMTTDREELVVAAVLNWVTCGTQSAPITSLESGSDNEDFSDTDDEQSGEASTNSLYTINSHKKIHDDQENVSSEVTTQLMNSCTQNVETREIVDTHSVVPVQCINVNQDTNTDEAEVENRTQHLAQLLSACRLFRVKSNFLDNVIKNNARLLVDTGTYQLMHEALMYTMDVSRRHDTWPDAAVYRASCSFKHVMVFLSKDNFMAYDLNTGHLAKFAELPEDKTACNRFIFTIFDNILYLLAFAVLMEKNFLGRIITTESNKELFKLHKNDTWIRLPFLQNITSVKLIPHGNNMYYYCLHHENTSSTSAYQSHGKPGLYRFSCTYEHDLVGSKCGQVEDFGNCLVRFHKYILVFCTKNDMITVEYYNTKTEKTRKYTTSMSGTSMDMVSFTQSEDVYILQRNGTLWKIFSTDTDPVDFELVCKLWDFDCSLRGCVLYKKTLFIFCNRKPSKPTLTSLSGIFTSIRIINIDSTNTCLPMTLKLDL